MLKKKILYILLLSSLTTVYANSFIPYNHKFLSYSGRIGILAKSCAMFYWPGSSITIRFKGTGIQAILKNGSEDAYFYAIVDGNDSLPERIKAPKFKSTVTLAKELKNTIHTLQLFKLSNNTSSTAFYGFELPDGAKVVSPPPLPTRKIEFYGNSITAGHGVDILPGNADSGSPNFFNNYDTYAAITARYFNAQYSCIARSGIGIMVSWFPEIMPEIYDRLNPNDPTSKWNFSKYTPDIVVINLFQNDKWITANPDNPQFKARFGTKAPTEAYIIGAYQNFVKSLRTKYPNAYFICALGSMDATEDGSAWPNYIQKAVEGLNDKKIFTLMFPYKNTPGHPKMAEQKKMASILIKFIEENISW